MPQEQFIMTKKYSAEIYEAVGLDKPNENIIRIYRSTPTDFTFQIRTHKPITESRKGKPRDMIATVQLTMEEWKEISRYVNGIDWT